MSSIKGDYSLYFINLEMTFFLCYYFAMKIRAKLITLKGWCKVLPAILYIAYCIDGGFFLIIAPWIQSWQKNIFFYHFPLLKSIFENYYFRGAISGIGLVLMGMGIKELQFFFKKQQTNI